MLIFGQETKGFEFLAAASRLQTAAYELLIHRPMREPLELEFESELDRRTRDDRLAERRVGVSSGRTGE